MAATDIRGTVVELLGLLCCMCTPVGIVGVLLGALAVVLSIDSYLDLHRAQPRRYEITDTRSHQPDAHARE